MQTNLWNIKNSKQRLGIRERTQAHKRHLISLVNAKSKLPNNNITIFSPKLKSLNGPYNSRIQYNIQKQNRSLVQRLSNHGSRSIATNKNQTTNVNNCARNNNGYSNNGNNINSGNSSQKKFVQIVENLKVISCITRNNKYKRIQEENGKMLNRLINTSPTRSVSRKTWQKSNRNNFHYKHNISKSKYQHPDYAEEVSRVLHRVQDNKKITYKHLRFNSSCSHTNISNTSTLSVNNVNKNTNKQLPQLSPKGNSYLKQSNTNARMYKNINSKMKMYPLYNSNKSKFLKTNQNIKNDKITRILNNPYSNNNNSNSNTSKNNSNHHNNNSIIHDINNKINKTENNDGESLQLSYRA